MEQLPPRVKTVLVPIGKWVQKTISATVFAVEIALRSLVVPAAVATAIAPGSMGNKIEAGIMAPAKIYKMLQGIPRDIENIDKITKIVEKSWSVEKIKELIIVWREEITRLYKREKERFWEIVEWYKNYREMPLETLTSIIIVILLYLLLASSVRLIRLGDRDTWLDATRKKLARLLWLKQATVSMTDKELEAALSELVAEYRKRGL